MTNDKTKAEHIADALEATNLSGAEIARQLDVTPQAVSGWKKTGKIDKKNAVGLARLSRTPVELLLAEESLADYNVHATTGRLYTWPLVSWVSAGLRNEAVEPYEPGEAPSFEFATPPSQRGICLQVRGDSMLRPDGSGFPDGCFIAVEPTRKLANRDFVVVRFADSDEATFKQYVKDGPVRLLKPLNPGYMTMHLSPDAIVVGVVAEMRTVTKF